jgi:hypothetical protein
MFHIDYDKELDMPLTPVDKTIEAQILRFLQCDDIQLDDHRYHCTEELFKNISVHWAHGDFVKAEIINSDEIRSFKALTPTRKRRKTE